jgi:hypothetical protein
VSGEAAAATVAAEFRYIRAGDLFTERRALLIIPEGASGCQVREELLGLTSTAPLFRGSWEGGVAFVRGLHEEWIGRGYKMITAGEVPR